MNSVLYNFGQLINHAEGSIRYDQRNKNNPEIRYSKLTDLSILRCEEDAFTLFRLGGDEALQLQDRLQKIRRAYLKLVNNPRISQKRNKTLAELSEKESQEFKKLVLTIKERLK